MNIQETLSIIKPDAVKKHCIGKIISKFESNRLFPKFIKTHNLKKSEAIKFYSIHKNEKFFNELVNYMCSGQIVVMILTGENAVMNNRELMGSTDPKKANPGTIRYEFGEDISLNAVHGSDSEENAKKEILFFNKIFKI